MFNTYLNNCFSFLAFFIKTIFNNIKNRSNFNNKCFFIAFWHNNVFIGQQVIKKQL